MENSMKSISTINPENTKSLIVETSAPVIDLKVGVLLDHGALQLFISSYFEHFE